MLHDLSYRYKTPLSFSAIALAVALAVSAVLIWRAHGDSKQDLAAGVERLSRSLARALVPAMLRDDVWGAYETIMTPLDERTGSHPSPTILVLDERGRIYAASNPARFRTATELGDADPALARLREQILQAGSEPRVVEDSTAAQIYVVVPITNDGGRLGTVVLAYASTFFLPRFYNTVQQVLLTTGAILIVLLPLGWYWGRRMAKPLVHLAACMDKVGNLPPSAVECDLRTSKDEIGHLADRFKLMLQQLQEKKALERQMVRANRLAAIGRITGGIAHEINNPLGGMLNAISTFHRHGVAEPFTARTVSLLERGLLQIREIVAALLVETRVETHALTRQDIEDVHTLVSADLKRKSVDLKWENDIHEPLPLPSTQVRQILINLFLNAVQAVNDGGKVQCRVQKDEQRLRIDVENDGRHISEKQMEHLFEPFAGVSEQGAGLGLWLIYQITQQLKGNIEVESRPGTTWFSVTIPFEVRHHEIESASTVPN